MNNERIEAKLRDVVWCISDYNEAMIRDIVECMQAIHERLKSIEERHDDRVDAMHAADEAMEEAAELEHGPY